MMHMGFAEVLILALFSGGMGSTDVVSLIQPKHYFQSRNVDVSIDKMIDLAGAEPKTPKDQIMQLTALRHLYDEAESLRKAKNYAAHRAAIEQIAAGKRGADPQGFAKDYANRLLFKLDGKNAAPVKYGPIREDALAWFPADTKFAMAADMRQSHFQGKEPLRDLLKLMPDEAKTEMYGFIEKIGNVRVERAAFGMVDAANRDEQKIFIRLTGKANRAWLADGIKQIPNANFDSKESKSDDGTAVTWLQSGKRAPAILLIGNTDCLIVGYQSDAKKHEDVGNEALAIRAKKKPSANTGVLKDRLAKVPDKAIALMVGEMTDQMRQEMRFLLDPLPSRFTAFAERMPNGLDLQAEGTLPNPGEADRLVGKVAQLRKDGIAGLKQAMQQPLPPELPPVPFQSLINVMESIQVQSQQEKVQIRAFVPDGLIQQLGSMGGMAFGVRARPVAPPPPPKDKKK